MHALLLLFVLARAALANCGGTVFEMDSGKPRPGATIKFVAFEREGGTLTAYSDSLGVWRCPEPFPDGTYLVRAAAPKQPYSDRSYVLVRSGVNVQERSKANASALDFRLAPFPCGGVVLEADSSQPVASATIKAVPFEAGTPVYTFHSGARGLWFCDQGLQAGKYLAQAGAAGMPLSERTYTLTVDSYGTVAEQDGHPIFGLQFRLVRPQQTSGSTVVRPPGPSLEDARTAATNGVRAAGDAINDAVQNAGRITAAAGDAIKAAGQGGQAATPDVTGAGDRAGRAGSAMGNATGGGTAAANTARTSAATWADLIAGTDAGCSDEVSIEVRLRPRKLTGEAWDAGLFQYVLPELKMILQPLPVEAARCSKVLGDAEIAPITLPSEVSTGACLIDKHDGDGGLFCRDNLQFRFDRVRLPRLPFHAFLMDIDIAAHDLIFEHRQNLFAQKFGIIDQASHRGEEEACAYSGTNTRCELKVWGTGVATISIDTAKKSCAEPEKMQANAEKLWESLRQDAFAIAQQQLPGAVGITLERLWRGTDWGLQRGAVELDREIRKAAADCDLAGVYGAVVRVMIPLIRTRPTTDVQKRAAAAAMARGLIDSAGSLTGNVTKAKIEHTASDLVKQATDMERVFLDKQPGAAEIRSLRHTKWLGFSLSGISELMDLPEYAEMYARAGAPGLVCQGISDIAQKVVGPLADCKTLVNFLTMLFYGFTSTEGYADDTQQFIQAAAKRGADAVLQMGFDETVARRLEKEALDLYVKLGADFRF